MFKFNRIFFIISNFIISFLIFILIYILRYQIIDFINVDKRTLTFDTLLLFLFYSFVIIILNVSFKIYEVNKITKIKESILINLLISVMSIGVIGGYFYFTQTNFARFVFFLGFIIIPFILSFYNKNLYILTIKKNHPMKISYFGNDENYILFNELILEYEKWFPMFINRLSVNESVEILIDNFKNCDLLIIDSDMNYTKEQFETLNNFEVEGGRIYSLVDMFGYFDQSLPAEIIKNQHFEFFSAYKLDSIYNRIIKRISDIIISIILLVLTSPIIILTAILVKLSSKGKVFYSQERTGLKGQGFKMLKFRSMVKDAEKGKAELTSANDARITFIGKIIRPLRIDELPQLINILKGDMSFIGPRPERKELIDKIVKQFPLFKKRLLVKPGLTGWAQVKYTYVNRLDKMNKKLSYDLFYLNNLSFVFDMKILLYTIETIIFRRGAI
jgi:exopolysaccharide biosynthesis polyprenyl glycosylphosphotransferase